MHFFKEESKHKEKKTILTFCVLTTNYATYCLLYALLYIKSLITGYKQMHGLGLDLPRAL